MKYGFVDLSEWVSGVNLSTRRHLNYLITFLYYRGNELLLLRFEVALTRAAYFRCDCIFCMIRRDCATKICAYEKYLTPLSLLSRYFRIFEDKVFYTIRLLQCAQISIFILLCGWSQHLAQCDIVYLLYMLACSSISLIDISQIYRTILLRYSSRVVDKISFFLCDVFCELSRSHASSQLIDIRHNTVLGWAFVVSRCVGVSRSGRLFCSVDAALWHLISSAYRWFFIDAFVALYVSIPYDVCIVCRLGV